jgi:hypothetical protein
VSIGGTACPNNRERKLAVAFNVKELLDQLDRDPVPVKCGDVFDVIVWAEIIPRLGCKGLTRKREK